MRFRPWHLGWILFQAIWLNVIVPGHTRGVVTLPGSCPECTSLAPSTTPKCCERGKKDDSKPNVPTDRAAHCAICAFAARLTIPPTVNLTPMALGFLERLTLPSPLQPRSVEKFAAYDGRAPPVIA